MDQGRRKQHTLVGEAFAEGDTLTATRKDGRWGWKLWRAQQVIGEGRHASMLSVMYHARKMAVGDRR